MDGDLPHRLRKLSRHLHALQSRSTPGPPALLFDRLNPSHPPPPPSYPQTFDDYDLRPFPATLPLRPDALSANIERLVVAALPIYGGGVGHISRIAKWKEPRRTLGWLLAYSLGWYFRLVLAGFVAVLFLLCLDPKTVGPFLFPAEPERSPQDEKEHELEIEEGAEIIGEQVAGMVSDATPGTDPPNGGPTPPPASAPEEVAPLKPTLAERYAPKVVKYGTIVQHHTGLLADTHERWRNVFLVGQPQAASLAPNTRLAIPMFPFLVAAAVLPTDVLLDLVTGLLGLVLFLLHPAMRTFPAVKEATDEERTVLLDAPTDRAWTLALAREVYRTQGIDAAMALLAEPSDPTSPDPPATDEVAPPTTRKRDRLAKFATQVHALSTAENRPSFSDIASALVRPAPSPSRQAPNGATATSTGASWSSSAGRDAVLRWIAPRQPEDHFSSSTANGDQVDSVGGDVEWRWEKGSKPASFYGYLDNVPGHLMIFPRLVVHDPKATAEDGQEEQEIESARLAFCPGLKFSILPGRRPPQETFSLPLEEVAGLRKSNVLGVTGVWGGLEGLEIVAEARGDDGKRRRWEVRNVFRRDEAFMRIVVMRRWASQEGEKGWVVV